MHVQIRVKFVHDGKNGKISKFRISSKFGIIRCSKGDKYILSHYQYALAQEHHSKAELYK